MNLYCSNLQSLVALSTSLSFSFLLCLSGPLAWLTNPTCFSLSFSVNFLNSLETFWPVPCDSESARWDASKPLESEQSSRQRQEWRICLINCTWNYIYDSVISPAKSNSLNGMVINISMTLLKACARKWGMKIRLLKNSHIVPVLVCYLSWLS